MASSSTVSTGDVATAAQYNNLRIDVLDTSSGHSHTGTDSKDLGTLTADLTISQSGASQIEVISTTNDAYLILNSDTDEGQDSEIIFESGGTARGRIEYNHHATANTQLMSFFTADNAVETLKLAGNLATFATAVDLGSNTLTSTGSMQIRTIDYSDGDLAMTIADGGGVTFAQDTTFDGDIAVNGDTITADGDLTINASSNVYIQDNLKPQADDTYDLGSSGFAWRNLYLEGNITMTDAGTITTSAGALTITSAAAATWSTAAGILTIDGDDGIVLQTTGSGGVEIKEDVTITGTTPLLTIGDNADEDTGLIFAGHDGSSNVDYHMGFDAGDNAFVIGTGTAIGAGGTRMLAMLNSNIVLGHPAEVAPLDYYQVLIRGDWTSGGGYNRAATLSVGSDLTGHSGDDAFLAHALIGTGAGGSITTEGNVNGTPGVIASLYLTEPDIDNTGGHTIDYSATLYIEAGASEATSDYALWVDSGASRFDGAISLGTDHGDDGQQLTSGGDDAACDWTAASSLREHKYIGEKADPNNALQAMLDSKAYHFKYKEKMGTGDSNTEYVGVMADDAPWAMHYKGKIVNPVNTLGYTVLSIQALNDKIETLEKQVTALGG